MFDKLYLEGKNSILLFLLTVKNQYMRNAKKTIGSVTKVSFKF